MKQVTSFLYVWVSMLMLSLFASCSDHDGVSVGSVKVTGFSPLEGLPQTEVTIEGEGFTDDARVYFNEAQATEIVSRSATSIVIRVPENASSGRIGVVVGEQDYGFSGDEFRFIPSAAIEKYSVNRAPVGETIVISGRNFFDIPAEDIKVFFGAVEASVVSNSSTEITVVVPEGAESAPISIQFADIQTIEGPIFEVGQILVDVPDHYFNLAQYESGSGSFSASDNSIESTKRGAWLVYPCKVDVDGLYYVNAQTATNQGYSCYLNIDMGTDMDELGKRSPNTALSQQMQKQGWATYDEHKYGPFKLKTGQQYYMRAYFWAEGTSWAGNAQKIVLHYAEDQAQSGIQVGTNDYNMYANDFNTGESILPFSPSWAWSPCYIKVVDQCAEFYYNQAALDADNRRERRGCELTCGFSTNSEGWYGFRFYLPEGKFPKDIDGSIIAQIFNNGNENSWAGHLSIDKDKLMMSHRYALIDPTKGTVGTVEWNKWIPVVVYFRAGRNGKGQIKVWMGDGMQESKPSYDSGNVSFGFGEWIDDTHLNNVDRDGYKGASLGAKFGLYVSLGGDRTIRFDDVKLLEGNPSGAFSMVKP